MRFGAELTLQLPDATEVVRPPDVRGANAVVSLCHEASRAALRELGVKSSEVVLTLSTTSGTLLHVASFDSQNGMVTVSPSDKSVGEDSLYSVVGGKCLLLLDPSPRFEKALRAFEDEKVSGFLDAVGSAGVPLLRVPVTFHLTKRAGRFQIKRT